MKYRKKPVIIEAFQYNKGDSIDFPLVSNWDNNPMTPDKISIETLEGWMNVSPGDYIITGVKGEVYPCKPDIFELTYDKV